MWVYILLAVLIALNVLIAVMLTKGMNRNRSERLEQLADIAKTMEALLQFMTTRMACKQDVAEMEGRVNENMKRMEVRVNLLIAAMEKRVAILEKAKSA